uniref:DUF58 domain-containing protein n=1 Tax=candidate division WOR-3 bacterium TaxID=2052148 RepID=A0A7V3ZZP4_UNCW3
MRLSFDPKLVELLKKKNISLETILEGYLRGRHRSPFYGHTLEFKDLRPYEKGDDLKFIDWRLYGRSERFFVKKYEEETNVRVYIALDISSSMSLYGKGNVARSVAAAIAVLSYYSRDAFGLYLFNEVEVFFLPPSSTYKNLFLFLESLDEYKDFGKTDFSKAMQGLDERIKKRSLIVLISDFLSEIEGIKKFVRFFKSKGYEVLPLVVSSLRERSLFMQEMRLKDVETGDELNLSRNDNIRYGEMIDQHYKELKVTFKNSGIRFFEFQTEMDFTTQLRGFLEI